jgi:hypothetical protein
VAGSWALADKLEHPHPKPVDARNRTAYLKGERLAAQTMRACVLCRASELEVLDHAQHKLSCYPSG